MALRQLCAWVRRCGTLATSSEHDEPHPSSHRQACNLGFLDLPPELRNRIYTLALIPNASEYLLTLNSRLHLQACWLCPCPSREILLCNRQIKREATSFLYGTIVFDFFCTEQIKWFPELIGTCAQHVRSIRWAADRPLHLSWDDTSLEPLSKLVNLESFEIDVGREYGSDSKGTKTEAHVRSFWEPHEMAKRLAMGLSGLQKAAGARKSHIAIADIVSFVPGDVRIHDMEIDAAGYTRLVRAELAVVLAESSGQNPKQNTP